MTPPATPPPNLLNRVAERLRNRDPDPGQVISRSNQGLVIRMEVDGYALAVKTPAGNPLAWKLRQSMLVREHRAYRLLADMDGIARCHGLVERRWLVLDFIAGEPFRDAEIADRKQFFERLQATIHAMHVRGVAHGDLKRKSNLLVTPGGDPVILDLGAAVIRKPGRRPINRRLFEFLCQTDLNAWVKLKYAGYERISAEDRALLRRSRLERILGRLRRP